MTGEQFLNARNESFHSSDEVEQVVAYLNAARKERIIPNQPDAKIAAYLGFLADEAYVNDGLFTGNAESIDRQSKYNAIYPKDTPRNRADRIHTQQVKSHKGWMEYLACQEYPDWFKYYTMSRVKKLTAENDGKYGFAIRSNSSLQEFPIVIDEGVETVFNWIKTYHLDKQEVQVEIDDQDAAARFKKALARVDFARLYAHSWRNDLYESPQDGACKWVQFEDTDVDQLYRFMQDNNYGGRWCITYGRQDCDNLLTWGGVDVLCTMREDASLVPRALIQWRTKTGQARVFGRLDKSQRLEYERELLDQIEEKLRSYPDQNKVIEALSGIKITNQLLRIVEDSRRDLSNREVELIYTKHIIGQGVLLPRQDEEEHPLFTKIKTARREKRFEDISSMVNGGAIILDLIGKYWSLDEALDDIITHRTKQNITMHDILDRIEPTRLIKYVEDLSFKEKCVLIEKLLDQDDSLKVCRLKGLRNVLLSNRKKKLSFSTHFAVLTTRR